MPVKWWWTLCLCAVGCSELLGESACEPAQDFAAVSDMLGARCGTLDCHGQVGRPLRLYTSRGLRLAADDESGHGGTRTAEHTANLRAVLGLEPELTCEVLADRGREPERLTLVRKAFGSEQHTAGEVLARRDAGRACLLSWLAGRVDPERCESAAEAGRPE
ncbi:MAG TPA: hypothetical protein VJR89_33550 [Polyangiales bacterium]|nr:hypothetical protein [Polyangiales bacterium]